MAVDPGFADAADEVQRWRMAQPTIDPDPRDGSTGAATGNLPR
jgi:hypothetical protein